MDSSPVAAPQPQDPYAALATALAASANGQPPNAALATAQPPPQVQPPALPGVAPGAAPTPSDPMMQKLVADKGNAPGWNNGPNGQVAFSGQIPPPSPQATPGSAAANAAPPTDPNAPPATLADAMAQYQRDQQRFTSIADNPPQYKAPNKWLEIGSLLAGLAFAGSPFSRAAAGFSGGLEQGAENKYARSEQQWQQEQLAAEKQVGMDVTFADAQQKTEATAEQNAIRNQQADQRIGLSRDRFNESVTKMHFTNLHFDETLKKDYDLAQERADVTMRGQNLTAGSRVAMINAQFKLQAIRDAAAGARTNANIQSRLFNTEAAKQANIIDKQLQGKINAIKASKATPAAQAQAIDAATTSANQALDGILSKAPPTSDLSGVSALGTTMDADATQASAEDLAGYAGQVGEEAGGVGGYGPQQGAGGVTATTPEEAGTLQQHGYFYDNSTGQWFPPGLQWTQQPIDGDPTHPPQGQPTQGPGAPTLPNGQHPQPGQPMGAPPHPPAAPPIGHGPGLPAPQFAHLRELVAQHAKEIPNLAQAVAGASPQSAQISAQQYQELEQTWAKTRGTQGAPTPPPATVNGHPEGGGFGPGGSFTGPPPGNAPEAPQRPQTPTPAAPHPVATASAQATPTKGEVVEKAAKEEGIPPALLFAVITAESSGNQAAASPAGAQGMGQLMPGTAAALGVNPENPVQNVLGTAKYLKQLLTRFHSIPAAIQAYNMGPNGYAKSRGVVPAETRAYLTRVLGLYKEMLSTSTANGNF